MKKVSQTQHLVQLVKRTFRVLLIAVPIMLLWSSEVLAKSGPGPKKSIARQKARKFQQHYLELAGGYGIWSHTFQAGMEPHQSSIDLSATYGNEQSPYGFVIGYTFHTGFSQDVFLYKPSNAYAGLRFSLLKATGAKSKLDPYLLAGVSYWQGTLTDDVYDGIINYQEKAEKDYGIGGIAGVGISYQIDRFRVGPQLMYHLAGNGQYLAGGFENQDISPSYLTLLLKASYRFSFGKGGGCPTYK